MVQSYKNPICAVWWVDAAYSFQDTIPAVLPPINIATGFIIEETAEYLNIASNIEYNKEDATITPMEGVLIPCKAILRFERLRDLREYENS